MAQTDTLEVRLNGRGRRPTRVGLLTRDEAGNVLFAVDQAYIELGPRRPLLSVAWHVPGDEAETIRRLRTSQDKQARMGALPAWFSNLLPEGALRDMVERGMKTGRTSEFDVLGRLGRDLPGAVIVGDGGADDLDLRNADSDIPPSKLRFSLAGVQLKFSSTRRGDRLTLPAQGETGDCIIKLPNKNYEHLPEAEFLAMKLAESAGVSIADCELMPSSVVQDIPRKLIPGPNILAVRRFDRAAHERVHIEDFAQILGAVGEQKYTRANEETVIHLVEKFSTDGRVAVTEAIRRVVVDYLIGNTDAHLKNWSFIYPQANQISLSPAYDIVATHLVNPADTSMALKLHGTNDARIVTAERFGKIAKYVGFAPDKMTQFVRSVVVQAAEAWSSIDPTYFMPGHRQSMDSWWRSLALTEATSSPF